MLRWQANHQHNLTVSRCLRVCRHQLTTTAHHPFSTTHITRKPHCVRDDEDTPTRRPNARNRQKAGCTRYARHFSFFCKNFNLCTVQETTTANILAETTTPPPFSRRLRPCFDPPAGNNSDRTKKRKRQGLQGTPAILNCFINVHTLLGDHYPPNTKYVPVFRVQ